MNLHCNFRHNIVTSVTFEQMTNVDDWCKVMSMHITRDVATIFWFVNLRHNLALFSINKLLLLYFYFPIQHYFWLFFFFSFLRILLNYFIAIQLLACMNYHCPSWIVSQTKFMALEQDNQRLIGNLLQVMRKHVNVVHDGVAK